MSGVIRALHQLRQSSGLDADSARQVDAGISLLEELLESLPYAHDLAACIAHEYTRARHAEGMTPRTHKLKRAYMNVERVLDACQSFSISTHIEAVDDATRILSAVMARIDHGQLALTRGDVVSAWNHGATIRAVYRNNTSLEVTLRRAHALMDDNGDVGCPEGHWLLEGGAWSRDLQLGGNAPLTGELYPDIYEPLGPELPPNIERIIEDQVRAYMRACAGDVVQIGAVAL